MPAPKVPRLWLTFCFALLPLQGASPAGEQGMDVLKKRCSNCHSRTVSLSGLDLSSRESILKGGQRGAAVVPGQSANSRLVQLTTHAGEPHMPPTGKLPDTELAALRQWIDEGFVWAGPVQKENQPDWWAFRPIGRSQSPAGERLTIDDTINRALKDNKLEASPLADRLTLLRRASFDLHGLPPSREQIDQFVNDASSDAWSKMIDRLLASPRYGEKWGRHWLDLVRYGDTAGFETDPYHLDAWRYRDYVIRSFNADKPYDQFVKEQLAGDELGADNFEAVTATGYFRVGPHRDLQVKVEEENRIEKLSDYVDTTSRVFLGLTVGCARCHDHKFDPIPQRDFYRMQAIFEPGVNHRAMLQPLALLSDVAFTKREFQLWQRGKQLADLFAPYEKQIRSRKLADSPDALKAFDTPVGERTPQQQVLVTQNQSRARVDQQELMALLSPKDRDALETISASLVRTFKGYGPPPFTAALTDAGPVAPPTFIALRGNAKTPGEQVNPGFLSILGGGDIAPADVHGKTTGRRLALANWIASAENPLTSRVMVNRIWQYHFGRGLVETSSDFGVRAGKPSHPELLDWLSSEFVQRGWSIKAMHRIIMNSEAYRRSSKASESARQADPQNRLLSHFSRRRLNAEEVRDSVLATTGELNLEMGGMPAVPPLDRDELYGIIGRPDEAWPVSPDPRQHVRRSVYLLSRRTFTQPMFAAFDHPDGLASCSNRNESTTAPQSLTLLNSRFMTEQARLLAANTESPEAMWRQALMREPNVNEKAWTDEFIKQQASTQGSSAEAKVELARVLLNLNEFLYVD